MTIFILVIALLVIVLAILRKQSKPSQPAEVDRDRHVLDRSEAPISLPDGRKVMLTIESGVGSPNRDQKNEPEYNDNYWIPVERTRRKVRARIELKYRNTSNQVNERVFDVESFSRGPKGYHIHGYCHRKQRWITLSSLGIIDPVDLETGELIEDINRYLEEKYSQTAGRLQDLVFDKYGWAVYCLVYLGASSGRLMREEREVISCFIRSLDGFSRLDRAWIDKTIKELYRPGRNEIRKWVREARRDGENVEILNEAIGKLSSLRRCQNRKFDSFVKFLREKAV